MTTIYVVEAFDEEQRTVVHAFDTDHDRAYAYLCRRESELFPWTDPIRVCYFRADSIEGLRRTHGNWFYTNTSAVFGEGKAGRSLLYLEVPA